jgi:hypothetical protein
MATFDEKVKELRDQGIEIDRPVEEFEGWKFGQHVTVIDDDPHGYVYAGDEGVLVPEQVGSEEHDNLQVKLYIVVDGTDSGVDVDPSNIEPMVE